ncbi:kinase-like domain-containing protein, partial [Leucosporidium creatinivorum]
ITATGHGSAADWWALGVLLFELLAGFPPFFADNPLEIYERILQNKFVFPAHIDFVAKDLIKRLLTADLSKRLGNLKGGALDVKNHRWFEGVDWDAVYRKEIRAPIIPVTVSPADTSNFERYPNSPLDTLPGVLRAHRARQYGMSPDALERGPDPYGYLFPDFCE